MPFLRLIGRRAAAHIDWLLLAALLLAAPIIALTPLLRGQLPGTNDAALHLHRLISAALNLRNGFLWPRWSPNLHFGFGYPIGNFYAPGWHIAGALLVIAGVYPVTVVLLAQAVGVMLYPLGGYLFGRQIGGKAGALFAAAIFAYAPFRFYELFEQGNISQLIAMGLMPWALWAIGRCARQADSRRVALGGLLLAALVVTHHPTAFAFLPFAALYALLTAATAPNPTRGRRIAPLAAVALGVLLSAIYWLPALIELPDVRVQQATSGLYQVDTSFVPLADLLSANQSSDRAALNPVRPFNAGQPGLIVAAGGLIAGVWPRRWTRWQRAHLISGAMVVTGCLYLMTAHSDWLWHLVPPAQAIQFPWRLMGVLTVATIPGAVLLIDGLPTRWQRPAALVGIVVVVALSLPVLAPIKPDVSEPAVLTPGSSIRYEAVSGNLGAVSTYEYTPKWATARPLYDPCAACYDDWGWFIRVSQPSIPASAQLVASPGDHRGGSAFQITTPAAFRLVFHQFYFPGWQITIDGHDQPIFISDPYGLLAVDVPAGSHRVEAWYGGTVEQHLGDGLGVFGLILCALLVIRCPRRLFLSKRAPLQTSDTNRTGARSERRFGLGLCALTLAFTLISNPAADLFRANGQPAQPKFSGTALHDVFRDSAGQPLLELVGADLPSSATAGQTISARLYWHPLQPLAAGWRVALKIQDQLQQQDWANSDNDVPGGYATDSWPLDRYVIDTHRLTLAADTPPYVAALTVRVYNDAGAVLHGDADNLGALRITGDGCAETVSPTVTTALTFGSAITLRGYTISRTAEQATLDLYWRVADVPGGDLALFIHAMRGPTMVSTADQSPIDRYPSSLWQSGQCLHNRYTFPVDGTPDRLLIGYYDRATGQRLPAGGQSPVEADGLAIPLTMP